MNSQDPKGEQLCYFFQFGLIVTGKGEREHLTKLFNSLMESQICNFQVIRFIGQRSPITSNKRSLSKNVKTVVVVGWVEERNPTC